MRFSFIAAIVLIACSGTATLDHDQPSKPAGGGGDGGGDTPPLAGDSSLPTDSNPPPTVVQVDCIGQPEGWSILELPFPPQDFSEPPRVGMWMWQRMADGAYVVSWRTPTPDPETGVLGFNCFCREGDCSHQIGTVVELR